MGIIRRQSIKGSIVNYVAVVVGMISMLFIYPAFLTPSEFGQIRFILGTALLVATVTGLGSTAVSIRFFPEFKDEKKGHHGLLGLLLCFPAAGFIIYLIATLLGSDYLPDRLKENYGYISAVIFFVLYINLFSYYIHNFKRIAIPSIFNNLFTKLGVPVLVILYAKTFLTFGDLLNLLVGIYIISFAGLVIYTVSLKQLHLRIDRKFVNRDRRKRIFTYMSYGVLGSLGSVLALRLDAFMVTEMLDYSRNGIYNISISISDIMVIPVTAIISISAPLISEKLQRHAIGEVDEIYKKSALNLTIAGLFILLMVWAVLTPFFQIMPNGHLYMDAKMVALVLCVGRLMDMVTSVNGQIIANSGFFRYNLYVMLFVSVINIIGNYLLIPRFNIMGAAASTLLSFFLLNLLRTQFVYRKFRIHPFSYRVLAALGVAIGVFVVLSFVPDIANPYVSVLVKGGLTFILFTGSILLFRVSEDINDLVRIVLLKIGLKR